MKQIRIFALFLMAAMITATMLSSTFARYTGLSSGRDTALIARWNMGARGEDDIEGEFYNKGFTFDLFDAQSIKPMDFGDKSFTFRGGGSDVAIAYGVQMNASDLMELTTGQSKATIAKETGRDVYAPFIFRIEAFVNAGGTDPAPVIFSPYDETSPYYNEAGWFRPKDIAPDEDGYFSIFSGAPSFSAGSDDEVTITVYWQWNTSYYIDDTDDDTVAGAVYADPSTDIEEDYLPYYQAAYDEYYGNDGLQERYEEAMNEVDDYLDLHGSPDSDGAWPPHDIDTDIPCTLSDAEHFAEYDDLVEAAEDAGEACETSLLTAYDDYDTFAANALMEKDSVKVLFRIKGEQIAPQ